MPIASNSLLGIAILILCVGTSAHSQADLQTPPAGGAKSRTEAPTELESSDQAEVEQTGHARMLAEMDKILANVDRNPYFGEQQLKRFRMGLARPVSELGVFKRYELLCKAGKAELQLGRLPEAIKLLTEAVEMAPPNAGKQNASALFEFGVAWLRMGENQNCCARNTPDSCILPIRGQGVHTVKEGSRKATEYLLQVLEVTQADDSLHLSAVWLLNIAAMTLSEHPAGVPEPYRIPLETYQSKESFPRFLNVARQVGLDAFGLAGGAIIDDFDGDGLLDVMVSCYDVASPMNLHRNRGDGHFEDITEAAGLGGLLGGLNMIQADYDNDGDLDLYVLRGAWWGNQGRHPNSLLQNEDGHFRDVTFEAGLGEIHNPTQAGAFADYDNDGDLDLFVGNESRRGVNAPCQLFQNQGDGSFIDKAPALGLDIAVFAKGVAWGDYDGDRFPDLYITTYTSSNLLFHNEAGKGFVEVGKQAGVDGPRTSFPTWFWDYDNDGKLDLFASCYTGTIDIVAAHYLGKSRHSEIAGLYRGDGKGGFENLAAKAGLNVPMLPMGANFGDINGDGFLDMYLGTGDPDASNLVPNIMFLNKGGRSFVDVTTAGGLGHLQKGHAVAFGDLDNDGDLDLFEELGGGFRGDEYFNALFENPGFGARHLTLELQGVTSNRSGIGARIKVVIVEADEQRSIYRTVCSGGSFGANSLRQTIGLGQAASIERVEVFWPTTDKTQTFKELELNSALRIVEGQDQPQALNLPTFTLGGN